MNPAEVEEIKLALTDLNKRLDSREKKVTKRLESLEKDKNQLTNPQLPIQQKPGKFQEVKIAFLGCLSNTTGHGLPQIVKPDNLFLNVLWVMFYAVAVSGCGFLIYQAVSEYCEFNVITITKIKRDVEMALPAVTFCSGLDNTYDMIIDCQAPSKQRCKMSNWTIYERFGERLHCVQLNYGANASELLQKANGEGHDHGYKLNLYVLKYTYLKLTLTDNNARVVYKDVKEYVYGGQETEVVLSKTVQTALGPPYSKCNESTEYRQVNCIKDCSIKAMTEICGCKYYSDCWHHFSNLSYECRYAYNNSFGIESKCYQECPIECNQVSFPLNTFDIGWNIDEQELAHYRLKMANKFNSSHYTDEEFKKRITRMYIYFDKLQTTEITQSPSITTTSFISNVGGLLGLFLGFSLLSSIEAVDLLIRICMILSRRGRSRTRP